MWTNWPDGGDQCVCGDGGQRREGHKFPLPWMLCYQAKGEAEKGLVTCQSPHAPESLTTRWIQEKSEPRVLRVLQLYQHHGLWVSPSSFLPCEVSPPRVVCNGALVCRLIWGTGMALTDQIFASCKSCKRLECSLLKSLTTVYVESGSTIL